MVPSLSIGSEDCVDNQQLVKILAHNGCPSRVLSLSVYLQVLDVAQRVEFTEYSLRQPRSHF